MPRRSVVQMTKLGLTAVLICLVFSFVCIVYLFVSKSSSGGPFPRVNLKELLAVSIDLARQGGDAVREVRISSLLAKSVKSRTKEGAEEFLTAGDLASHRAMLYGFKKAFPEIKVISEEHDSDSANQTIDDVKTPRKDLGAELQHITRTVNVLMSDVTVWIDPLDATQEYTENLTEYVTTMVCVAVRGTPVIGVVHNPFTQQTAWAWVAHGSSPNLFRKVEEHQSRMKYKVIVSRSHAGSVKKQLEKAFADNVETVTAGGAGYKVLEVLSGRVDAYLHVTSIKKWDICAGNALLEAGYGRLTTLKGHMINYSANLPHVVSGGLLATVGEHIYGLHALFLQQWQNMSFNSSVSARN